MKKNVFATLLTLFLIVVLGLSARATQQEDIYTKNMVEYYMDKDVAIQKEVEEKLTLYYTVTFLEGDNYRLTDLKDESNFVIITKPVFTTYDGDDIMLFINGDGALMNLKVGANLNNADFLSESAHIKISSDQIIIHNYLEATYTYEEKTGRVQRWHKGILEDNWSVPKDSKYCGFSDMTGYLFRDVEDNIYSLTVNSCFSTILDQDRVIKIAENVDMVLVANYWYSEEQYGVPLLLMNNGCVRAYVNTEADLDKADNLTYLVAPIYEGGYRY